MNFVDIENLKESCDCLSKVPSLREIYLTGNPCEKFKYCREYIIGRCPQIIIYDGNEVKKSERIKAREMMDFMEKELEKESKEHVIFKQNDPSEKDPNKYSVEYRRNLYKDLEKEKLENERKRKEESSKPGLWDEPVIKEVPPPVYKENGEVVQSYAEMSSMFSNFSLYLVKQKNLFFIDLKEYFKYVKNNYRSMKEFLHKTENLKNTFYKSFKSLKTKKEDLFRKQEVNKWDLDPKDTSIDRNSIATNKNLALEKMLHKETLQVNYQKVVYGFYLNKIISEHERMKLINGSHHLKYCINMFEVIANNCTDFMSALADNTSNLRKNLKSETTTSE